MESPRSTIWPSTEALVKRVDSLSLTSVAKMREIPFIPFPDDTHPKAVEFAMIVRNEFTKRLKSELVALPSNIDSAFVRGQVYKVLRALRDEIVQMASAGNGWLERQLAHGFMDGSAPNIVYCWADRYLDAMLISIEI